MGTELKKYIFVDIYKLQREFHIYFETTKTHLVVLN